MADYKKWDNFEDSDDEAAGKDGAGQSEVEDISQIDTRAARLRAEQAKVDGAAPNPLDDLFSLKKDSSFAELREKMKNLPQDAKRKFVEQLSKPDVLSSIVEKADALRPETDPTYVVNKTVEIVGLKSRADLNGSCGKCCKYLEEKGRFVVQVQGTDEKILLKGVNLKLRR
jgi:hypothetical protein